MSKYSRDSLTPQEERALALVTVYKTVTAEQIGQAMGITWQEADKILLRLHFTFSRVRVEVKESGPLLFHIV